MTNEEGVQKILEVEEETDLFIPVCLSKKDVEDSLETSISDEDWWDTISLVEKYADFSSEVIEAIETAMEEI